MNTPPRRPPTKEIEAMTPTPRPDRAAIKLRLEQQVRARALVCATKRLRAHLDVLETNLRRGWGTAATAGEPALPPCQPLNDDAD